MKPKLQLELTDDFSPTHKLNGIPKIICRNDPKDISKKRYMEDQFKKWNIENYKFYNKKYNEKNYSDWKDLILDVDLIQSPKELALTLNVIESIIEWYDSEESEVCIFMEDVVDLSPIHSWIFDWKLLEYHLPYNWDCIQFFISAKNTIKMHLHPWQASTGSSSHCFMVTRYFAKKLKHYHYKMGKFKLHNNIPNKSIPIFEYGSLHGFFYDLGITYTIPIFSLNNDLMPALDTNDMVDRMSSEAIKYWWDTKSCNYSIFEFFHYNKEDEWRMEVLFDVNGKRPYVFKDKAEGIMIWI